MEWFVVFRPQKMEKRADQLPPEARTNLVRLMAELIKEGPEQLEWPHYSRLKGQKGQRKTECRYHCHIQTGRQAIVACWKVWKDTITVEVYYVGSHGKAPY